MSYREIAAELETRHGLKVHSDTINSFVIVRAKRPRLVHSLPPKGGVVEIPPKVAVTAAEISIAGELANRAANFFEVPAPLQPTKSGPKWNTDF